MTLRKKKPETDKQKRTKREYEMVCKALIKK